jgi:hypothetical protein
LEPVSIAFAMDYFMSDAFLKKPFFGVSAEIRLLLSLEIVEAVYPPPSISNLLLFSVL